MRPKRRYVQYQDSKRPERLCPRCKLKFLPDQRAQKYCLPCKPIIKKIYSLSKKVSSRCWIWPGSHLKRNKNGLGGYGRIKIKGKAVKAHRLIYTAIHGPVPEGLLVLHKCDTPPCFNPAHLFTGTHYDNSVDKIRKGRDKFVGRPRK